MKQIVAFSGGKDSTALVLRLAELGEAFECLFTPTLDEPDDVRPHIDAIVARINRPLVVPPNQSLMFWVLKYDALPNWRQRWCTRQIKIQPCIDYLSAQTDPVLCVGLRADEEAREGLYGPYATYRYPMREWNWKIADVQSYLAAQQVTIPTRTDCELCYGQRLSEWYRLWRDKPEKWARGELVEAKTGHTFRSAGRDTWPAAMKDLRAAFEAGRIPRGVVEDDQQAATGSCRVCRF